jgi:CRISPR/Cas system CSM-associated protein Csm5 (group 7 of RAMP superfamily)
VKREHNQYTQVYNHNISLSRSYYNLGSRFSYTKESLKPKDASKDISKFVKVEKHSRSEYSIRPRRECYPSLP